MICLLIEKYTLIHDMFINRKIYTATCTGYGY